jgi:ankyrin repeat protein
MNDIFVEIKKKNFKKVYEIIEKDEHFDVNMVDTDDEYGNSLLVYAINYNEINLVKLLIERNVRLDVFDSESKSILYHVIKFNYIDILELLLESNKTNIGISLVDIRDKKKNISLNYAIKFKNLTAIKLLLKYDSNVNLIDNMGNNSLHLSIYTRSLDIIKLIFSQNIDINSQNNNGDTAAHITCSLQIVEALNVLLENKNINLNIQNNEGLTLLHISIISTNINILTILLERDININLQDSLGNTGIHHSIIENNYLIFKLLSNSTKIINYNIWNIDGNFPLHLVFIKQLNNLLHYLNILIEKTDLNFLNNNKKTSLHYICKNKIWQKYKDVLSKKKINIVIRDNMNNRAIDYINDNDKQDFIDILVKSYLYRIRNNNSEWKNKWENLCKKEVFYDRLSEKEKNVFKDLNIEPGTTDICKNIIEKKIKYIIDSNSTCNQLSYPQKKSDICLNINMDNRVDVCTFVGSTLDILVGLIFLLKKHKNVCSVINKNILITKDICTFYENNGLKISTRCQFLNFEILWIMENLYLSDNFVLYFKKCASNKKKKFIIIPIGIELDNGSHANYLIYDIHAKEIERFEPHGSYPPIGFNYNSNKLDKILENKIKAIEPNIKYIKPIDYLPKIGFQILESQEILNKRISDPPGFCAVWSIWYVDIRVNYPEIDRKKLVTYMIHSIKINNISFKNLIRNYSINITKIRDSVFSKASVDINDWINDEITDIQLKIIIKELSNLIDSVD